MTEFQEKFINEIKCITFYADLTGLPPLYIEAGDCEVFLDEITKFAKFKKHTKEISLNFYRIIY